MTDINEILKFVSDWKSNRQIKKQFDLSQTQFYHVSRWLIKANLVQRCTAHDLNKEDNRVTYYKKNN